jgi:hypothetical protein
MALRVKLKIGSESLPDLAMLTFEDDHYRLLPYACRNRMVCIRREEDEHGRE